MDTPISVTTISGDDNTPVPKIYEYNLTITFPVSQYGTPVDPDMATALNRIFHDWNDGRHPLPVEMVDEGLNNCIKNALYQICQKRAMEKYGDEMVQLNPSWRRSRWSIEAEKEYEELRKAGTYPGWCNEPSIKIERTEHER